MVKHNYFDDLERLSEIALSAVTLVCHSEKRKDTDGISELRRECDGIVCRTEDALFSDFIPPLERDGIAAISHGLSRIVDRASELLADPSASPQFMHRNEEAEICVRLAAELRDSVYLLRRIKKPSDTPDLCGYRRLLSEGRAAHKRMLCAVRAGSVSRSHAEAVILTARLRTELSAVFDELVEIMLNNI